MISGSLFGLELRRSKFYYISSVCVWSCFLLSSWTSLQQQALNLTMNLTSSISLFVTFSSSKWSSEPVGHCWYVSHCPCSFRMSIRNRPQSAQCQWVTYVSTVSPITHRLHSILPPSLFFLSHSPLLYAHTHAIPPVQKDGWDVPNHRCCSTCESFCILHCTIQSCF